MVAEKKFFGFRVRCDLVFRGVFLFSALLGASSTNSRAFEESQGLPVAVIYNGKGACREGCAGSIARIARQVGLQVRYVNEKTLSHALLRDAAVYIQPGGEALEVLDVVSSRQLQDIRDYVAAGGRYLGICAGAFLADTYVDDQHHRMGLALLPGETIDYHPDLQSGEPQAEELILPTLWTEGRLPGIHGTRHLYFSDGAGFRLPQPDPTLEVLAAYSDSIPAVVRFSSGAGKVVLSGVHPEAPRKWWRPDSHRPTPLVDPDGEDHDIARALVEWLIQN